MNQNKKKLVQINSVCNGSTGKIMGEIQRKAEESGFQCISFYGRGNPFNDMRCKKINNDFFVYLHGFLTLIFNNHGRYSYIQTKMLVRKLRKLNPDVIQLHNIHGYYLNYEVLFKYLKSEYRGEIFWTFHDCWPFTGHCAYFDYVQCDKWKKGCNKCPQIKKYPFSLFFDTSSTEYKTKRKLFTGIKRLSIITPSNWLNNLVKKSYLKEYPVITINNGIDLKIFKKRTGMDIVSKYKINPEKKIILGVSNIWEERKGLSTFIRLSKELDKNIQIVLVGITKNQAKSLPNNIITIERTDNQEELVKLYSISDIFLNPTLEDNYPTVNLESIACGTPVITFNTGGCREEIFENTGFVVDNYDELKEKIIFCIEKDYKKNLFNNGKILNSLDANVKFDEYIKLYKGSR